MSKDDRETCGPTAIGLGKPQGRLVCSRDKGSRGLYLTTPSGTTARATRPPQLIQAGRNAQGEHGGQRIIRREARGGNVSLIFKLFLAFAFCCAGPCFFRDLLWSSRVAEGGGCRFILILLPARSSAGGGLSRPGKCSPSLGVHSRLMATRADQVGVC